MSRQDESFAWWRRAVEGFGRGVIENREARRALCGDEAEGRQRDEAVWRALYDLQRGVAERLMSGFARRISRESTTGVHPTLEAPWSDLPFGEPADEDDGCDSFGDASSLQREFHRLFPRAVRRPLGEFHTPEWLAEEAVDLLPEEVLHDGAILDPGCGSGVFLRSVLKARLHRRASDSAEALLAGLAGIDLNPLAVLIARISLALELLDAGIALDADVPVPVMWADSVLGKNARGGGLEPLTRYDALVGNPPWVGWDTLSSGYRETIRSEVLARWRLFSHEGFQGKLGFANDDVLHVFTTATIERFLRPGGDVVYLVKQTLFQNEAGKDFRRFRVRRRDGSERPLEVRAVHDLRRAGKIFDDGAGETALMHLKDGRETRFPVRWFVRRRDASDELEAAPPGDDPLGPWAVDTEGLRVSASLEGSNDYAGDIRHGIKHDAEGVFSFRILESDERTVLVENMPEKGKRSVRSVQARIEKDLVFPYLKSRHTRGAKIADWSYVLVPQRRAGEDNETWLCERLPLTYAYLMRHREALEARSSSIYRGRVFYTVFGLGPYSWLPYRVAWCGMAHRPEFFIVETVEDRHLGAKLAILDGAHYAIATRDRAEADYLHARLNAPEVRTFLDARAGRSKRSLTKSLLSRLRLARYGSRQGVLFAED